MYFHFIFIFKDGVRIIWLCNHNRQTSIKPEEQDHTTAEYLVITECVRLVWYLNIYIIIINNILPLFAHYKLY